MMSVEPNLDTPLIRRPALGWWTPGLHAPTADPAGIARLIANLAEPVFVGHTGEGFAAGTEGEATLNGPPHSRGYPLAALVAPLTPEHLGDPAFPATHRLRYPYMAGAMANGIASVELVEALGRAGFLGSFGAAGLSLPRVTEAVERLQQSLGSQPFAVNLIHSPNEPAHEMAVAALYLARQVRLVEASAYLDLTPAIVRYRVAGLSAGANGEVQIANRVIAKVSRVEVAARFLAPPPPRVVANLLREGLITPAQAALAPRVPMCDDLTAEADSGGHTDNRPAIALFPTLLALRDRMQAEHPFPVPVRVGLGGGISTPQSVAAAFSLGAAYVVTGSINQACIESGSSDLVRTMLAEAGQADTIMAPAADMFEMGVKVQVLKRGTMFAMRGAKLFELYRQYPAWEAIPEPERVQVEKSILRRSFAEVWAETRGFFAARDPAQVPRAEADPKHKMALVFRWYLGLSSRWANAGDATRQLDFQVWCGPAMGAFNEWAKGSFLEAPAGRTAVAVAHNLLTGACDHLRRQSLVQQGVFLHLPAARPQPTDC